MSATEWFDRHEKLVVELRAATPVAPESLRERVLDAAPEPRRRLSFSLAPRRRLALVVVPLALVGAVTAALVHGFLGSGSGTRSVPLAAGLAATPEHAKHGVVQQANPPVAGVISKATDTQGQTLDNAAHTAAGAFYAQKRSARALVPGAPITIPKDRLVHADASLTVRVQSHAALTRATNKATQIVSSLGGYAQSVQYQSSHKGSGEAYLSLRVPVGKAETAMGKLAGLGALLSQQVQTQDLEQTFTHQTSRIATLRRAIAIYEQALRDGTVTGSQRVETEIKLSNARHQVTQLRKARGQTLAAAATADIQLTLTTSKQSVVGPPPKQGRFDRMLRGAAGFLGLEGIVVLYALVVLSPVLVLGGLAWALVRERRRRDERRLLASA